MSAIKEDPHLFYRDKNVSKVSGVWKALHISIYVAIAVNSFMASMAIGNMFKTFRFNCILFCTDIVFEQEILQIDIKGGDRKVVIREADSIETDVNLGDNQTSFIKNTEVNFTSHNFNNDTGIYLNATDFFKTTGIFENGTENIIFKNKSYIEEGSIAVIHPKIDLRKSRFSSHFWCNLVLGTALITFIFATFCGILLTMCSKGGRGPKIDTLNRPQNMLYPIVVTSITLAIVNTTVSIFLKNGLDDFCQNFEIFTNEKRCSHMIDKFTLKEKEENFYIPYLIVSYSFDLNVIFFCTQIFVTMIRILYAADYQLYALEVDNDEESEGLREMSL